MVMIAIPTIIVAIAVSPFGVIGHWISLGLGLIANVLLWGAMIIGFYVNVYRPWRVGKTTRPNETIPK
jgi:hypothetical protein